MARFTRIRTELGDQTPGAFLRRMLRRIASGGNRALKSLMASKELFRYHLFASHCCPCGTHSLRRTMATLIYRRTGNLRAVQLLLGHTKIESTVRYLGIEVDDALAIAEQVDV